MSAYVVSYETLNKILAGIDYTKYRHSSYPGAPNKLQGQEYSAGFEPEALTKLGRELLYLNVRAVYCRYEDMRPKTPSQVVDFWLPGNEGTEFFYDDGTTPPRPLQLYKTLQCFLYQCSEGTIIHDPLFKEMEAWANRVGHFIISMLPEYETAVWG